MFAAAIALTLAAAPAPVVHVHAAGDPAFRANAYLVETAKGVVAVDAPFTVSEAKKLRAELDALHKPLLAVLITHAHPDHVNGIGLLTAGTKARVVALSGVDKTLRAIDAPKRAYWKPIYKDEYPDSTAFPTQIVKDGETLTFDGASFTARDLGQGESEAETVWVLGNDAAFTGDLVMNRVHPWLAEGHSAAWLRSLEKAQAALQGVRTVYPGHGEKGGLETLAWQKRYLEAYRAAVRELSSGKAALTDAQKKELSAKMEQVLPAGPLAMLVGMSADAVAAELAAEKPTPQTQAKK
ncbi:MAG TPA: MBL fold metallo-hydrolase, partial [Myxococcales bacterium]|nr:MBL fold metallo-hydrolase [Myxococcales bacterium]